MLDKGSIDQHTFFRADNQPTPDITCAIAVLLKQTVKIFPELINLNVGVAIIDLARLIVFP